MREELPDHGGIVQRGDQPQPTPAMPARQNIKRERPVHQRRPAPGANHNRHSAACGIPPAVSTETADLYVGYFENRYGEQWIFMFDRATREARLRGGDAGWDTAHPVRDGRVDGLILAPEEAAWLQACWSATRT